MGERTIGRRKTAATWRTRLNFPLTSFVGRKRELAEVKQLLSSVRLLTLTGPGGCGKSRLALQVAGEYGEAFEDGITWVDLVGLSESALVTLAVVRALDLREASHESPLDTLSHYLKAKHLLLVLDNCEHLLAACRELVEGLLLECSILQVLATSREPLAVEGELTWLVPALSLPDAPLASRRDDRLLADLERYDAIHLFVERAQSVLPTFTLTNQNRVAVVQVCRRLDGMPLAIELAAARVNVLTVQQIAARLDDRFSLLTGGNRTALIPRHQTLRATMDWSYDLLSEQERILFRRLSVFSGGFALEAAEAIGPDHDLQAKDVLDLLSHLIDKSLVVANTQGSDEAHYRLLETIRQYALEKLQESAEEMTLRWQHFDWFLRMAQEADSQLRGPKQAIWLDRLEAEHDNLQVALEWSLTTGKPEAGLPFAATLTWFWFLRGYFDEGRAWLQRMLAENTRVSASDRAKALYGLALMMQMQRDIAQSAPLAEESLALSREANDKRGIALALSLLTDLAYYREDYERATTLGEESVALFRDVGDKYYLSQTLGALGYIAEDNSDLDRALAFYEESLELRQELGDRDGIAYCLYLLGPAVQATGDHARATKLLTESLTLYRAVRNPWGIASSLRELGYLALNQGDYDKIQTLFEESLELFEKLGDKYGMAAAICGLAMGAAGQEYFVRSAQLFGAAMALREAAGMSLHRAWRAQYELSLSSTRTQLTEASFNAAWQEGHRMTRTQAIQLAMSHESQVPIPKQSPSLSPKTPFPALAEPLNERELEMLRLIADGLSNHEIAERLVIALSTVKWHINNLFGKLSVRSRTQALVRAKELGLL